MAAVLHTLDQRRLIDSNGIADGSSIHFYLTGTTTPATIYSDNTLATPLANPVVVNAGAAVPNIYLDSTVTYRRVITYSDGGTDDADPYTAPYASQSVLDTKADASAIGTVMPTQYGAATGLDATILQAAYDEANTTGKAVLLNGTYRPETEIETYGVRTIGTGTIKRIDQRTTTTTAAIATGTGTRTFTVASAASFAVGMSVLFVRPDNTIAPDNSFSQRNPVITAIVGTSVTITTRSAFAASVPSGSIMATASRGFMLGERSVVEGVTFDGNTANQQYSFWTAMGEVFAVGNGVTLRDVLFTGTSNDAAFVGGTVATPLVGFTADNCTWRNVGNNAVHMSYMSGANIIAPDVDGCNKRYASAIQEGGSGAVARSGHQDGAFIFSDNCTDMKVTGGIVRDAICGVGALGSHDPALFPAYPNLNDDVLVDGTTFDNCRFGVEVTLATARVQVRGTKHRADVPLTGLFDGHDALFVVGGTVGSGLNTPKRIVMDGAEITNGRVSIAEADGVSVNADIDNSGITVSTTNRNEGIYLSNSNDVSISGRIAGGIYGITINSGYNVATRRMRNIDIAGVQLLRQKFQGVRPTFAHAAAEMGVTIRDSRITSVTGADATYKGLELRREMRSLANTIDTAVGTSRVNVTRRVQNARGDIVNGVFSQDYAFTPYTSVYHAFIAGTNGAVTPTGDVYSCTVSGGTADTWRHVAHTTTYSDGEDNLALLRIVPKNNVDTRAYAGWTNDADPTGIDPLTGIDYGWVFFDGEAYPAENVLERTGRAVYAASAVFWVVRTAANVIEYWKGGDGVTHTTGTLVFTSVNGANEVGELRGKVVIRGGAGAVEVRMFG